MTKNLHDFASAIEVKCCQFCWSGLKAVQFSNLSSRYAP